MGNLVVTAADGGSIMIDEDDVIFITSGTLGSLVTYVKERQGIRYNTVCSQSPAVVAGATTKFISCTVNGQTVYVNVDRIDLSSVDYNATGAFFTYDVEGQHNRLIQTTTTVVAFQTALLGAKGYTVYAFDDVNATNDTISLTAATGDKSSSFTSGVYFSVFGSATQSVNGIYKVSSSTYTGGKTVITVNTTVKEVPTGATETGSLYIS